MHLLQVFPLEVGVRERGQLNCDQTLERASWQMICNVGDVGLILGWEDPPEEGKATHTSILAWRIPWTV